jgi:hypothetical protein
MDAIACIFGARWLSGFFEEPGSDIDGKARLGATGLKPPPVVPVLDGFVVRRFSPLATLHRFGVPGFSGVKSLDGNHRLPAPAG